MGALGTLDQIEGSEILEKFVAYVESGQFRAESFHVEDNFVKDFHVHLQRQII